MVLKKVCFLFVLFCLINLSHADTSNLFTQFDSNNNQIFEENELDQVFVVLRPTIIEKFELSNSTEKYAKSIFLFNLGNPTIIHGDNNTYLMKLVSFDHCLQMIFCKSKYLSPITVSKKQIDNFMKLIE